MQWGFENKNINNFSKKNTTNSNSSSSNQSNTIRYSASTCIRYEPFKITYLRNKTNDTINNKNTTTNYIKLEDIITYILDSVANYVSIVYDNINNLVRKYNKTYLKETLSKLQQQLFIHSKNFYSIIHDHYVKFNSKLESIEHANHLVGLVIMLLSPFVFKIIMGLYNVLTGINIVVYLLATTLSVITFIYGLKTFLRIK